MNNQFPSAFNPHCLALEPEILRWAWNAGLFEEVAELERCRLQRINSFPGFLFPSLPSDKLAPVMKFFLCLFLLDDLLDVELDVDKISYLEKLSCPTDAEFGELTRTERLGKQLSSLHQDIGNRIIDTLDESEWEEAWEVYISGLQWEVKNKSEGKIPSLSEYRISRPYSSGVYLAIQLLRPAQFDESCMTLYLEMDIARFICLSNDLDSLEKEHDLNDFHNEVRLLQLTTEKDVLPWVAEELNSLRLKIFELAAMLSQNSESCGKWVSSLLHLVGGCMAWASGNLRYQNKVNGKSRLIQ
ncbi:terpene synthase family protein [Algoriphagus terrigena]|uniref:terpene synthase family protein n=1 Tax=Algoriphagus terrigena TaxID=344884 RepID=UPI000422F4D0|nr:terpene synthase family protein [Algoriphagus terrigena]